MSEIPARQAERPVLRGEVGKVRPFTPLGRGEGKVVLPGFARQSRRLKDRFKDLDRAFEDEVQLSTSLGASDPELIVVFEGLDERTDLTKIAMLLGFEIVTEVEATAAPSADFPRKGVDKSLPLTICLHAICVDQTAMAGLLKQWRKWRKTGKFDYGYGKLKDLFAHLKDVRAWGPQDRLKLIDWDAHFANLIPGTDHEIEIELWYRQSALLRQKALAEVTALVRAAGGRVITAAIVEEVGYHAIKCIVPLSVLQTLVTGDFGAIGLVRSSHVMYFRVTGQAPEFGPSEAKTVTDLSGAPQPSGEPLLCLLDGVPNSNHPLLAGRVTITDPDDLTSLSATTSEARRHGTAMASVCVWGDLSAPERPASRPVLVRPILSPSAHTIGLTEELRPEDLPPDLMRRVFRELFDGVAGQNPTGPEILVINLSVGDPSTPFDNVMSSWARTIDWLSSEYGVLIIVSAGNHTAIERPAGATDLSTLTKKLRAIAINSAVAESSPRRSLLSPAESINAICVGALNSDQAGDVPLGYTIDPADGTPIISPLSALGSGHRRSVKPDIVAPGGRVRFQSSLPGQASTTLRPAPFIGLGPGIRTAGAQGASQIFTRGTSPSAAISSRTAAQLADLVQDLLPPNATRRQKAVGTKALLAHSARIDDDWVVDPRIAQSAHGYGALTRHMSEGCAENEATLLFVGSLGANEMCDLLLPMPNGLQKRGVKRITATLAWLSPVNWRHRQYRRAALSFAKPQGMTALDAALDVGSDVVKRGTLQHSVWEVTRAVPFGQGQHLQLTVQCAEQAGGLAGGQVDFSVAVTLWVAPELEVDVYQQVRTQLSTRIPVTPSAH